MFPHRRNPQSERFPANDSLHLFLCFRMKRLSIFAVPVTMAVPKKKTSKSKRDKRRATWRHKAVVEARKALSLGKSILTGRSTFVYPTAEEEEEEES